MEYLVSAGQMKTYDQYMIEKIGVDSLVLMERAAMATAEEIIKRFSSNEKVLVVAGCGNNGGDGFAVGRILQEYGFAVSYVLIGNKEKCSLETQKQIDITEKLGNEIKSNILTEAGEKEEYGIIIDAIFGIGLSREITGIYKTAIEQINAMKGKVVSIDIPSGIHGDTGAVMGVAVKADLTVTYGYRKMGLVFYPGADYAGAVICRKIGIFWQNNLEKPEAFCYDLEDFARIPARIQSGNKGTFGKVLVIAGSHTMYGACMFSALGAYRSGAGLVRVITAIENKELLLRHVPEAIVDTYDKESGAELTEILDKGISWADCVVIGPGLGTEKQATEMLQYVLEHTKQPLIIDADGLNILSEHQEWLLPSGMRKTAALYLTPHMGEFSRLTKKSIKYCKEDIIHLTKTFAKEKQVLLIAKDARTVVASPESALYVNLSGNSGMATGGSGDVLTGILAGLLAQGMQGIEAAAMAVYLHGLTGEYASLKKTEYSVMAGDLLEALPHVLAEGGKKYDNER